MKDNPKKRWNGILNYKGKEGITLVALIITVIVLIILAGTATSVAINHFNTIRQNGFYTKLELAEEAVKKIINTNESYVDKTTGKTVYLKELPGTINSNKEDIIRKVNERYGTSYKASDFKYFTKNAVEQKLGIAGVDMDLLIDFNEGIVICPNGVEINGKMEYMSGFKDEKYKPIQEETKNEGEVDFAYKVETYSSTSYKVTITPTNIGDITKGVVEYKNESANYWETAKDNEFLIPSLGKYYVRYTDANNNSKQKKLNIDFDESTNQFVVTEES